MNESLALFERLARSVAESQRVEGWSAPQSDEPADVHPFESRNIHPELPPKVRSLFDDGHPAQAVFEAMKFVEHEVKRISRIRGKANFATMMAAFNESNPKIRLNDLQTDSQIDEQRGYMHIFAGTSAGIRNPRGHEVDVLDSPDEALDYLALASLLLRRLDAAGVR